ncbi:MAG: hypothetical protein ACI9MC_000370 [Kiritimatiellia bacterium]|jgi:hypothetical protein
MDTLLPLLCLALGVSLPLVGVALVFRRALRQLAEAGAYREVAQELGLVVDTRGVSLHGVIEHRPLWVGEVMVGHGPDRQTQVHGVIGFRRPLGLGLHVRRRRRRIGKRDALLGDELVDKAIEIVSGDVTELRELLAHGARGPLFELVGRWPDVELVDDTVRVRMKSAPSRPAMLGELVERLSALAQALEWAREHVQRPERFDLDAQTMAEVADELGLELLSSLPAMRGTMLGLHVELSVVEGATGIGGQIRVMVDQPQDTGFRLRPQVEPDGYWSVGQDIQVNDTSFDAAFVIKGDDPQEVCDRLSPEIREQLLTLCRIGIVEADDHGLTLRVPRLGAKELTALVRETVDVTSALARYAVPAFAAEAFRMPTLWKR